MVFFRYTISHLYHESKVQGLHPRETFNYSFDILSPTSGRWKCTLLGFVILHIIYSSHLPDAEIIYIVSEVISELHGLLQVHCYLLTTVLSIYMDCISGTAICYLVKPYFSSYCHFKLLFNTAGGACCCSESVTSAYCKISLSALFILLCTCIHLDWFGKTIRTRKRAKR